MTLHNEIGGFIRTIKPSPTTATGVKSVAILRVKTCLFAKARMKVSRYNASGMIQTSGIEATSVEMCVVTPSIKLDGISANATHCTRFIKGMRSI